MKCSHGRGRRDVLSAFEEDARRLAVRPAGRRDRVDGGQEGRVLELAGHAQAVREIGRSDEQDVDTVKGGHRICIG